MNDYWYDPYGNYFGGKEAYPAADVPLGALAEHERVVRGVSVDRGYYKIGLRNYDHFFRRWAQTDLPGVPPSPATRRGQALHLPGCNPTSQTDPSGAASCTQTVVATSQG